MKTMSDSTGGVVRYREMFDAWLEAKRDEIAETKKARRYYHGNQWTAEERRILEIRKQPIITANRIQRKIDGIVGLHSRYKQAPKAYARTPKHEAEADISSAVIRFVCDNNDFDTISAEAIQRACISGIFVAEMNFDEDPMTGEQEITLQSVENERFFYDPRSVKPDFSDARYMGLYAWIDIETAIDMFPDKEETLKSDVESVMSSNGNDSQTDWRFNWFDSKRKLVKVCETWRKRGDKWMFCFHTGNSVLAEGESPFVDDEGKSGCRIIAGSAYIDESGDRYGLVRNMISPQDEINHRRSKLLHMISVRQTWGQSGVVKDVNEFRTQMARPDGHLEIEGVWGQDAGVVSQNDQTQGQAQLLAEAKDEIENFGPNQALIGQGGVSDSSGRAIALLQQAGMAELNLFFTRVRGWKLRIYRMIWQNARKMWTAERSIRVTDNENAAQFIPLNSLMIDPSTGQPVIKNNMSEIDVDIIIDEGQDAITLRSEQFEKITRLAQAGIQFPPEVLLEFSDLDSETRTKIKEIMQQAAQAQAQAAQEQQQIQQQAMALEMANKQADTGLKQANAEKAQAQAFKEQMAGSKTLYEPMLQ